MISKALTLIFFTLSSLAVAQIVDEVPRQVAADWLILVDGGKYSESWKAASPLFRSSIPEESWIKKMKEFRDPLGALKQRSFVTGRFMQDPEGMPKGEYFVLEYETQFEKKKILELVVPMKDETGLWQVASYSVTTPDPAAVEKKQRVGASQRGQALRCHQRVVLPVPG